MQAGDEAKRMSRWEAFLASCVAKGANGKAPYASLVMRILREIGYLKADAQASIYDPAEADKVRALLSERLEQMAQRSKAFEADNYEEMEKADEKKK